MGVSREPGIKKVVNIFWKRGFVVKGRIHSNFWILNSLQLSNNSDKLFNSKMPQ